MSDADAIDAAYYGDGRFEKRCIACATKDAEIARLREALSFYASDESYEAPRWGEDTRADDIPVIADGGDKAQAALSSSPQSDGWISGQDFREALCAHLRLSPTGSAIDRVIDIVREFAGCPLPEPPEVK